MREYTEHDLTNPGTVYMVISIVVGIIRSESDSREQENNKKRPNKNSIIHVSRENSTRICFPANTLQQLSGFLLKARFLSRRQGAGRKYREGHNYRHRAAQNRLRGMNPTDAFWIVQRGDLTEGVESFISSSM